MTKVSAWAIFALLIFLPFSDRAFAASQIIAWGDVDQTVIPLTTTNVVAVAAAHFHDLWINALGTVQTSPTVLNLKPPSGLTNVTRVAGGLAHDLALRSDGTVVTWGDNSYGQTSTPASLADVVAVAAGGYYSLALTAYGSVVAWGDSSYGQTSIPSTATNIIAVAAGFYHSIALRADGTLVCWGDDSFGQTDPPDSLTNVVAISAGGDHCLALTADGRVVAWGDNSYGQSSVPTNLISVIAIAAGDYHSLALRADGTVVAWGPHEDATVVPPGLSNVVAIAAGGSHSVALQWTGPAPFAPPMIQATNFCGSSVTLNSGYPENAPLTLQWSFNGTNLTGATAATLSLANVQTNQSGIYSVTISSAFGQLVTESIELSIEPALFVTPSLSQTVLAGGSINLSASALSTLPLSYQWQLNGTNLPGATTTALSLSYLTPNQAGIYSLVASNAFGTVSSLNRVNVFGLLEWDTYRLTGANLGDVVSLTRSRNGHVLVIRSDGTVAGWGAGLPPNLTNIVATATGYAHALTLTSDGTVIAWGANPDGETDVPKDLTNAVAIAVGDFHNLALRSNGTVVAWGGDDYTGSTDVPPGLTDVVAIAAGTSSSMALTSAGHVIAWGTEHFFPGDPTVPTALTDVVAIAAGDSHFLALKNNGTVFAWGNDSNGQTDVPPGLSNVVEISAIEDESLALTADGRVVAWGVAWGNSAAQQNKVLMGLSNVVAIAAGDQGNNIALLGSGPPHLNSSLVSRSIAIGETTSFRATAVGMPPLAYQWQLNGTNLPGKTNPVLALTNLQSEQAGTYSVIVTNLLGVASQSASLNVKPVLIDALNITPYLKPAYAGGNASLSVTAQGLDLTYQWLSNGIAIPGATNSSLTLSNLQTWQTGSYSVAVSNGLGTLTSDPVPLAVLPLWISTAPKSQTNYAGGTAVFSVFVAGAAPLSYQWSYEGVAIPDETNYSLTLTNVQFNQAGEYSVLATNVFGGTNASASLVVSPFLIVSQPQNQTNFPGGGGGFYAEVSGDDPLTYQWTFNGTNLLGATDFSLDLYDVSPGQSGSYALIVSNVYGVVTTAAADLVVLNLAQWPNDSPESLRFLSVPADVTQLAGSDAGWCLALTDNGNIFPFPGVGSLPQPPPAATNVSALSAGWQHALALRANGTVLAWGDNQFSQTNVPDDLSNVVAIASGAFHNLALKSDGTVTAWGANAFGQAVVPPNLTNIVSIAAGTNDSLAINRQGQVFAWGADYLGQPVHVPADMTNVLTIASSGSLFPAIRNDGTMAIWQNNSSDPPFLPDGFSNIVAMAASSTHDLELTPDGIVVSWENPTNVPAGLMNVQAVAIAIAGSNNFAVLGSTPPSLQVTVDTVAATSQGFTISIPTLSGRVYGLEYKDSLAESQWKPLPLVAGNGNVQALLDPARRTGQRFYRVLRW